MSRGSLNPGLDVDFELDDAAAKIASDIASNFLQSDVAVQRLRELAAPLIDAATDALNKLDMIRIVLKISFVVQMLAVIVILVKVSALVKRHRGGM